MSNARIGLVINKFAFITPDIQQMVYKACEENSFVILAIGSADRAPNSSCPFTYDEREEALNYLIDQENLEEKAVIQIVAVDDYLYNNPAWIDGIHRKIYSLLNTVNIKTETINVYSADNSGYDYTKFFPNPKFNTQKVACDDLGGIEKTYFEGSQNEFKNSFTTKMVDHYIHSLSNENYDNLKEEYLNIKAMKEQWSFAPYPPSFITTDAIVYYKGFVLLVRRKSNVGSGLLCLPGGFLPQNSTVNEGIIKNLKKDTSVKVHEAILKSNMKTVRVFDDPSRSLRGRIVTHAGLVILDDVTSLQSFPEVRKTKGNKEHAGWFSIYEIETMRHLFFEDHYYIIKNMINNL